MRAEPYVFVYVRTRTWLQDLTYPRDELSDHARPRPVGSRNPVQPVPDQPNAVLELQDVCQLFQHVHTEALVAIIPLQILVVLPQHHIWILLKSTQGFALVRLMQESMFLGS